MTLSSFEYATKYRAWNHLQSTVNYNSSSPSLISLMRVAKNLMESLHYKDPVSVAFATQALPNRRFLSEVVGDLAVPKASSTETKLEFLQYLWFCQTKFAENNSLVKAWFMSNAATIYECLFRCLLKTHSLQLKVCCSDLCVSLIENIEPDAKGYGPHSLLSRVDGSSQAICEIKLFTAFIRNCLSVGDEKLATNGVWIIQWVVEKLSESEKQLIFDDSLADCIIDLLRCRILLVQDGATAENLQDTNVFGLLKLLLVFCRTYVTSSSCIKRAIDTSLLWLDHANMLRDSNLECIIFETIRACFEKEKGAATGPKYLHKVLDAVKKAMQAHSRHEGVQDATQNAHILRILQILTANAVGKLGGSEGVMSEFQFDSSLIQQLLHVLWIVLRCTLDFDSNDDEAFVPGSFLLADTIVSGLQILSNTHKLLLSNRGPVTTHVFKQQLHEMYFGCEEIVIPIVFTHLEALDSDDSTRSFVQAICEIITIEEDMASSDHLKSLVGKMISCNFISILLKRSAKSSLQSDIRCLTCKVIGKMMMCITGRNLALGSMRKTLFVEKPLSSILKTLAKENWETNLKDELESFFLLISTVIYHCTHHEEQGDLFVEICAIVSSPMMYGDPNILLHCLSILGFLNQELHPEHVKGFFHSNPLTQILQDPYTYISQLSDFSCVGVLLSVAKSCYFGDNSLELVIACICVRTFTKDSTNKLLQLCSARELLEFSRATIRQLAEVKSRLGLDKVSKIITFFQHLVSSSSEVGSDLSQEIFDRDTVDAFARLLEYPENCIIVPLQLDLSIQLFRMMTSHLVSQDEEAFQEGILQDKVMRAFFSSSFRFCTRC